MGAVIGTGSYSLIDGSTIRTPGVGVYLSDEARAIGDDEMAAELDARSRPAAYRGRGKETAMRRALACFLSVLLAAPLLASAGCKGDVQTCTGSSCATGKRIAAQAEVGTGSGDGSSLARRQRAPPTGALAR